MAQSKKSHSKWIGWCKSVFCDFDSTLCCYLIFATLRIILTLLPQSGYIHPDEFFQSAEVVAGDIFDIEVNRPWEFNTTFPVRSVAVTYLVIGIPYFLMKIASPFINLWFNVNILTAYSVLVVPRYVMCLLSFTVDYSLYRICRLHGRKHFTQLAILSSSYVMVIYGTRTFSNTFEMILVSLLLYLVTKCMFHSEKVILQESYYVEKYREATTAVDRVKYYRLRSTLPKHSYKSCFYISLIAVFGIFNRPTFGAFALPPLFFWLLRGMGTKVVGLEEFHFRIFMLIVSGLPTALSLIIFDSLYFGHLTAAEIIEGQVGLENFVVTPLNFIKYNVDVKNLAQHGIHPRCLHILVNIPLLYNILGVIGILTLIRTVYYAVSKKWSKLPRLQSITGVMALSLIVPVLILSVIPHQEARFLIPISLPIVFLFSEQLYCNVHMPIKKFKHVIISCWYITNILLMVFFGFLHQGGIYPLLSKVSDEIHTKPKLTTVHLVTSHIYTLPMAPLLLENSRRSLFDKETGKRYRLARSFYTYELGSMHLLAVAQKLETLSKTCEEKRISKKLDYRLYLAIPSSLFGDLEDIIIQKNYSYSYSLENTYPHISTEAMPSLWSKENFVNCKFECEVKSSILSTILQQFTLYLLKIER